MKKNICIVLGGTGNIAFSVYVTISSIIYHNDYIDNFIVFYDNWNDNDINALMTLSPKIKMKEYNLNKFLSRYSNLYDENSWAAKSFSHMVFCKFEIFNLLNDYKNVIFFDSDILVRGNIKEIFDFKPIALRKIPTDLNGMFYKEIKYKDVNAYNGGVIYINENLTYKNLTNLCYDLLYKNLKNAKLPDQAIMGLLFYENNIKINELPIRFNDSLGCSVESIIIHFNRKYAKIWDNKFCQLCYPEYNKYYNSFIENGGTSYNSNFYFNNYIGETCNKTLQKLEKHNYWEQVYFLLAPKIHNAYFIDPNLSCDKLRIYNKNNYKLEIYISRSPLYLQIKIDKHKEILYKKYISKYKHIIKNDYIYIELNLMTIADDINSILDEIDKLNLKKNIYNENYEYYNFVIEMLSNQNYYGNIKPYVERERNYWAKFIK